MSAGVSLKMNIAYRVTRSGIIGKRKEASARVLMWELHKTKRPLKPCSSRGWCGADEGT